MQRASTVAKELFQIPAIKLPKKVVRLLKYRNYELFLDGGGVLSDKQQREYKRLDKEFGDLICTNEDDE